MALFCYIIVIYGENMSYPIIISQVYLDVLKNLLKVANKREVLFFKENDDYMISLMDMGTLVHISTTESNISYQDSEVGISNMSEFMDYVKAVGYPKSGDIKFSQEKSTKGRVLDCLVFSDDYSTYRTVVADPTKFTAKYDKKVPVDRSIDPMSLVAQFTLDEEDLARITNDIKLMKKCEIFGVTVGSDISLYMRGIERQQVTRTIDSTKARILNSTVLKSDSIDKYRLFPSRLFSFMSTFDCEFDVELRYLESRNIVAFKAFGKIENPSGDPINVYVASSESTSQIMSNFDIIE